MPARPSGRCLSCGRPICGRMAVNGKVILQRHNKANKGTKESGFGPAIPCPGEGTVVDLLKAVPDD